MGNKSTWQQRRSGTVHDQHGAGPACYHNNNVAARSAINANRRGDDGGFNTVQYVFLVRLDLMFDSRFGNCPLVCARRRWLAHINAPPTTFFSAAFKWAPMLSLGRYVPWLAHHCYVVLPQVKVEVQELFVEDELFACHEYIIGVQRTKQ